MVGFASTASRATAFGLAALGALAVAPSFPSLSRAETADAAAARAIAVCVKYRDPAAHAQCAYDALGRATAALKRDTALQQRRAADADRRAAEAIQRGKVADQRAAEAIQRGAEADRVSECADFLMAGLKKGLFTKGAMLVAAKGKVTAANACEVARGFGRNQKAELDHPSVQ